MTRTADSPFPGPQHWPLGQAERPSGAFVALVPGEEAPLVTLSLPPTLHGAARLQVARRQVQDRLGFPGALLWPLGDGPAWTRAVIAAPGDAARWRTALSGAGARCRALLPDYLALPAAEGLWVLAAHAGRVLARLGHNDGFSAEPALAAAMLARAGAAPRAVLLLGKGVDPAILGDLAGSAPRCHRIEDLPADLRPGLAAPGPVQGVDLRAEASIDPATPLARHLRAALWPAALMLAGAAAWSAATVIETRADRAAAEALRTGVEQAARRDILPPGPIIDLRAQVLQAVDARRGALRGPGPADPLAVLRLASTALSRVQVDRLTLTPDDGLSAQLSVPDFAALDALVDELVRSGLRVVIERSAADREEGVSARLSVSEGTP